MSWGRADEGPYFWINVYGPNRYKTVTLKALSAAVYDPHSQSLILTDEYAPYLYVISKNGECQNHSIEGTARGVSLAANPSSSLYYSLTNGTIMHYNLSTYEASFICHLPASCHTVLYTANMIYSTSRNTVVQISPVTKEWSVWAGEWSDHRSGKTDGWGQDARFNCPYGISALGSSLVVVDSQNDSVRIVTPLQGYITSFLQSEPPYSMFPPGIAAMISEYCPLVGVVRTHPARFNKPTDVLAYSCDGSDFGFSIPETVKIWVVDQEGLHRLTSAGSTFCYRFAPQTSYTNRRLAIAEGKWLFVSERNSGTIYRIPWSDLLVMGS